MLNCDQTILKRAIDNGFITTTENCQTSVLSNASWDRDRGACQFGTTHRRLVSGNLEETGERDGRNAREKQDCTKELKQLYNARKSSEFFQKESSQNDTELYA